MLLSAEAPLPERARVAYRRAGSAPSPAVGAPQLAGRGLASRSLAFLLEDFLLSSLGHIF